MIAGNPAFWNTAVAAAVLATIRLPTVATAFESAAACLRALELTVRGALRVADLHDDSLMIGDRFPPCALMYRNAAFTPDGICGAV